LKIEGDAISPVHAFLPDASDASAADSWLIDAHAGIRAPTWSGERGIERGLLRVD